MSDPKYVRLANRLSNGICVDLNSGWSISGMDVQPVPDKSKHPMAAAFIRSKLNTGVLEPASLAEYEEVEEARSALDSDFQERVKFLAANKDVVKLLGIGNYQEAHVLQTAATAREAVAKRRETAGRDQYSLDQRRREAVAALLKGDGEASEEDVEAAEALVREQVTGTPETGTGTPASGVSNVGSSGDGDDDEDGDDVAYEDMKVADLKAELKARGVEFDESERTKAPLIALLEADDEDEDEDES